MPRGITFEVGPAFPRDDGRTWWAGSVAYGTGRLGGTVSAMTGSGRDGWGLLGEAVLARRPTSPFQLLAFGGVGNSDPGGLRVPVGASAGFRLVLPHVTVTPWLAPRAQFEGDDDRLRGALGGGLDARFRAGLGLRAAYDVIFRDGRDDRTFALGFSWTFDLGR